MATFQDIKEEIKSTVDIVSLIGEHVRLKRTGKNYVGLCPFHSEKNPSFTVNPEKQIFHCYGCKKGGDIFSFWMEYHNMDFVQALRDLAERFNISFSDNIYGHNRGLSIRDSIYRVNEIAAQFYHEILLKSRKGKDGREYLEDRGFSGAVITEFKLGYAPSEWRGLFQYIKSRGIDPDVAEKAGLLIKSDRKDGYYDRFRGRVIFPIMNLRNQVVGFGARVLDDSLPKYLNTPETPVFNKGKILYGLNRSYKSIRENGSALVVEGYTDLISLWMHGFREGVATLGTSLTHDHIRILKGYTEDIVTVFDSDEAGIKATLRSIDLFLNQGINARILILPENDDPDTFVKKNGMEVFRKLIPNAAPMLDFYLEYSTRIKGDDITRKVAVLKEFLPVLHKIENQAMLYYVVRRFCEKMGLPERTVLMELEKSRSGDHGHNKKRSSEYGTEDMSLKEIDQQHLLNLFLNHPVAIKRLMNYDLTPLINDSVTKDIIDAIFKVFNEQGELDLVKVMENLDSDEAKEYFREISFHPSFYSDEGVDKAIRDFQLKIEDLELARSMEQAKRSGDIQLLNELLHRKTERMKKASIY